MPSTTTTTTTLLLLLLLSCTPLPLSSTAHNRRILHQPLFPVDSSPPTPPPTQSPPSPTVPKYPFSSPTPPDAPFFPTYPSPPSPPSPSSIATPVNVSSLDLPKSSKSNSASSKLIIVAVAAVVAAIIVVCIAVFLHIKKRRNTAFSDTKTSRSDTSTRYNLSNNPSTSNTALNNNGINGAIPKLSRPSQTSAEFLYLGTLVSSHAGLDTHPSQHIARSVSNNASLNTPKMDSPELRPLPPLNGRRNNPNVEVGPGRDEESEEFYSPRGSIGGRESSIGGGSASRRAFAAVEVANFNGSTSSSSLYSSSSSGSGSPARSVSLSISPRFSVSPKNSRPKSPELDVIQLQVAPPVAPAPPPPPPPHARSAFTSPHKDSLSPSPTSSRYSRSVDSSPRISHGSNRNLESPVSISSPVPQSMLIFNPYYLSASEENKDSSDIIRSPVKIASPEKQNTPILVSNLPISNVTDQNTEYPERISSPVKQNMHVLDPDPDTQISNDEKTPKISSPETLHLVPPPIFIPPPPPPPPPPSKYWESPRTPTPPPREPLPKPPILVAPLRPMVIESPTLISPMQLPSHNETSDKNESNEKNEETPKPKLKPLHWDKVRASSDREMVWDQLRSSSFRLNEEMIESLFIFNTPNPTPKETTRRQILPSPTGENRVLDPKKSQNIAILLKALHVTVDEVCEALSEGNTDTLGTDLLENLLKMAPTKEEERKLKAHKDDSPIKLGHAERFLKAVLDIPFAFKRVDALLYIANFDSEVEYLKKSFETLESACEELRNGRMFLKLLEAVLKTGNRMNVGTNRGDAHAFKLDTLLKLVDVKGADGKTTLLHFVVQEITRSEGARLSDISDDIKCRKLGLQVVSGLSSELTNVKKAATMDSDVLNSDALKLTKGLEKISEIVKLNEESSGSDKFSESMNLFLKIAEEEMIRIQAQESVALTLVKEITEYFHGNSAREEAHPFRIFMVVRDFLTVLDRVCKEVGRINERTIVSSAHKFPIPVNPMLQSGVSSGFPGNEENNSSP